MASSHYEVADFVYMDSAATQGVRDNWNPKISELCLPKPTKMPKLTKLFTMQEASQHNTKDDCWVVIDGKVYDMTSYLDEHPGGDDVVIAATGKDATEEFEDAGHSRSARELMENFCIGELEVSSSPEFEVTSKKPENGYDKQLGKGYAKEVVNLTKQYWGVPVAIVGISVVVGFLYLRKK
ncbi:hypothetical protein FNV43_RR26337 [Rhamnella rubrinervis]|uniref:Cytochrome b5 heme-binding domain-containing protein n=1 Tax=Rhamnella rubrinervis TaxID=2594499 RepID=A0A8K0GNN9_9ROSA|nr:hypothetical protein FNV43_RR26337 [Rhamnella rubrinervis]